MLPFFKCRTKTAFTVETRAEGNLFDRNARRTKQKLGRIETGGNQILMWCKASLGSKYSGKMKRAHIGVLCKNIQRKRFTKVFIDIGKRVLHNLRMGKITAGVRTNIQQTCEHLCNIRRHTGFFDRLRVTEHT